MRSLQRCESRFCRACRRIARRPGGPRRTTTLSLFQDWRSFQKPKLAAFPTTRAGDGSAASRLAATARLARSIPRAGRPAEGRLPGRAIRVNGLDFDHRVLQPWARNPAFYVTVVADESDQPARRAPSPTAPSSCSVGGSLRETRPTSSRTSRANSSVAAAARGNLTGNARDLWRLGIHARISSGTSRAAARPGRSASRARGTVARAGSDRRAVAG